MSNLPDGIDYNSMRLAVAFEIASEAFGRWKSSNIRDSPDEFVAAYSKFFVNAFEKTDTMKKE